MSSVLLGASNSQENLDVANSTAHSSVEQAQVDKESYSGSSELTPVSSYASSISSSRDNRSPDASVEDRGDRTREETDSENRRTSDDDEGTPMRTSTTVTRDERNYYRDLLLKRLEQMFVKAGLALTSYGRVPWTKLGETLAAGGCYISGFPEDLAPTASNDQLSGGSAPSTWGVNRSKPLLNLIESGKLQILRRPPGRRVLFELVKSDGSKYDSTIGYSSRWLHDHMRQEFPAPKRSRKEAVSSPEPDYDSSSDSFTSVSEKDWKPNRKKQRLESYDARLAASIYANSRKTAVLRRTSSQTTIPSTRNSTSQKSGLNVKQGEKWKDGGIVKKVGKGWIVVEESSSEAEEDTTVREKSDISSIITVSEAEVTSKKRKRSEPPESGPTPTKRPHVDRREPAISDEKRLQSVMQQISKLIKDCGYVGSRKLPWSSLPTFLCQKKLFITGFPNTCIPRVIGDEVKTASSPPHWKAAQVAAMEEAFAKNLVKVLPRPDGRRVLFSTSGVDGKFYDTTCGYSDDWIAKHLPDTVSPAIPEASSQSPGSTRPSLKIIIPNSSQQTSSQPVPRGENQPPIINNAKPVVTHSETPPKITPLPRADIPTPIIFLQPPTPEDGQSTAQPPQPMPLENMSIDTPREGAAPPIIQSPEKPNSPHALVLPPSPPPMDPVSLPKTLANDEMDMTPTVKSRKRGSFTFTIPPARSVGKARQKRDSLGQGSQQELTSIDGTGSGYDLSLLFEANEEDTPAGSLPLHLVSKVPQQLGPIPPPATLRPAPSAPTPPRPLLPFGQDLVGKIDAPSPSKFETKHAIEKVIRPALIKLFDAAGLSSPENPIPWVTLPQLLCSRRLFISGFPKACLPRVVRDRVDWASGPKHWSFSALTTMHKALKAGDVKIRRRPRERVVLFHILPTDAERELGNHHGTDSTLNFSQAWLNEFMTGDTTQSANETMQFEPLEASPLRAQTTPATPLRPVWERLGRIKIDESDSEEDIVVPEPPWKVAMEELTRPPPSSELHRLATVGEVPGSDLESDSTSEDSQNEEDEKDESETKLSLAKLVPSHLPFSFQRRGRVILTTEDVFEWLPNDPYATDCPPSRMVWNPHKGKWKLLPEIRDMVALDRTVSPIEIPTRVGGHILRHGVVEHNPTINVWECSFVGRDLSGDLRWSPDIAAWEWILHEDGKQWLRRTPTRTYEAIQQ
ncbi:hypothetical protein PIIN_02604 [Serendipita indica DSM 11827]|uniref:Uncharacterized protein n=1 Tax=Serendipita indica (strain DSM 11827) TaxID=1109443 RepID=G4TBN3_SERID|nr:hypothetical protein PIIN_02604 [Serendipita indica DSM 11827]